MNETDATLIDEPSAESTRVGVEDGVDLHVVRAGDPDDPLVVLLHGFSDFWYGWCNQIPALVDAGYRVVAPDIRGFNLSDKPRGLDAYRMGRLSGDVVALIESEGRESARVVGHDMGGQISWDLAQRHPERVERLGIVNVPHLSAFRRTLWSTPRQLLRSWYGFFFQVPRLPEWLLGRNDAQGIVDILTGSSRPGAFTADELEYYRRAYTRQGGLHGAVNYYRALFRRRDDPPRERVAAPTLVVWGEDDEALVPELASTSLEYCDDGRLERFPDATHWVHREAVERVNELLVAHLAAERPPAPRPNAA